MNKKQQEIWDYLKCHALGINNAIHIEVLADALNIPSQGTNNDNVRAWITSLVRKHYKPIGTCNDGVFVILTDEECEEAAKFVERDTRSTAIRRNGIYTPE